MFAEISVTTRQLWCTTAMLFSHYPVTRVKWKLGKTKIICFRINEIILLKKIITVRKTNCIICTRSYLSTRL